MRAFSILRAAVVPLMMVFSVLGDAQVALSAEQRPAPQEKTLRIAYFGQDLTGIDPLGPNLDPDSYSVISQLFDSLIHADLDGNLVPGLALSWKQVSDTQWHFSLRKNVKFHNGEVFDANAVKFTFDYVTDPKNGAGNGPIHTGIKSVTVRGENEVSFELKAPDAMFLNRLLYFGPICPPKYVQEKGMQNFHLHPVGTGPFKLEKVLKGKEISLVANRDYWLPGRPLLDRVRFLVIPDRSWVKALERNEVDFVPNLQGNLARTLVFNKKAQVKIIKRLVLLGYTVLLKNKGPLADANVRRALNYAIDKDALIKFADFGNAQAVSSLGKSGEFGAAKDIAPYPYDPKKAKQLLAQAGVGKGMELRMLVADTSLAIAKIMKSNLSDVGVNLVLDVKPRHEVFTQILKSRSARGVSIDYDLAIFLVDDPIYTMAFHASIFFSGGSPLSLLDMPEYDQKLRNALTTTNHETHRERLEDLDRYFHDQALSIFTTQRIITAAVRKGVTIDKFGLNGHLDYDILTNADIKAR